MIGLKRNRVERRGKGLRRARAASVAGTAATAMTLGLAAAPAAQAITIYRDYTWDPVYTSGLLAGALDFASKLFPGVDAQLSDTISFQTGPPPSLGLNVEADPFVKAGAIIYANIGLQLNLRRIAGDTANLYNAEAGLPQPGCSRGGAGDTGVATYGTTCRYAIQLATLGAELNLLNAYRAQVSSVQGNTPPDLTPFTAAPGATTDLPSWTNQALIVLQNPVRPNGGILARFPGLSEFLGIDPTMPAPGQVLSTDRRTVLNTSTFDLTWAYDPVGDFPAVSNIFALTNSAFALLPLNIVTGGLADAPLQGSSLSDIGLNLASVLQLPLDVTAAGSINIYTLKMEPGKAFYSTLVPNELPIVMAMGFPSTVANFALKALGSKYLLGNPWGDALAPAMKILVNTAYTDVLTPDKLDDCATGCGTKTPQTWAQLGYSAYDRTFGAYASEGSIASAATPTPIDSVDILTPDERAQMREDVFAALSEGIKAQLAKPLWGFIVPAESASSASSAGSVASRVAGPAEFAPEAPAEVPVPDIADPMPSLTSVVPVAGPKQGSVRPGRGKAERVDASAARKPAASAVAAGGDVKPAASAGKHRISR